MTQATGESFPSLAFVALKTTTDHPLHQAFVAEEAPLWHNRDTANASGRKLQFDYVNVHFLPLVQWHSCGVSCRHHSETLGMTLA